MRFLIRNSKRFVFPFGYQCVCSAEVAAFKIKFSMRVLYKMTSILIYLFGENPEDEFSGLVGFECARNDDVAAGRKAETAADLAQVDEGFGSEK